jgi:hypothetical protein
MGRCGGTVFRLQLPREAAPALRVRDDVLSAVDGNRDRRAGEARAREPVEVRSPRRAADEHAGEREPVGRAVRMGAAADDRGRWAAALRLRRRRRSPRREIHLAGGEGIPGARHDRREVRRPPPRIRRGVRHQVRLLGEPDRIRLDERRLPGPSGRRTPEGPEIPAPKPRVSAARRSGAGRGGPASDGDGGPAGRSPPD